MPSVFDEVREGLAGRYELVREIGRGGMATVYLARDVRHDRQVAIKVMDPEVARAVGPERFTREIRLVASLTHPNVLPLLDSGEVTTPGDGRTHLWYATPYVRGESLRRHLAREGQLPVGQAARIAVEVAEALDYAHRQGFIHRDITPGNILLQDGHALVADFGIGRAVDPGSTDSLTASGVILGTPAYASPEQVSGETSLDGRTDVYSLGCVLYEMLSGRSPYRGASPAAVIGKVLTGEPEDLSASRPAAGALAPVVGRAMARLPADRFQSGREFADAVRAAVPASSTGELPVAGPPASRRSWTAVALVVVAVLVLLWGLDRRRPSPDTAAGTPTIAVLPLQTTSSGPGDNDLAAGMHSQIIDRLGSSPSARVLTRRLMMEYESSALGPDEVARELDASHVVDATLAVADGRVRVGVSLFNATGGRLWGESYIRPLQNVFELQAEIADGVASQIEGIVVGPLRLARDSATFDPAAIGLWARGKVLFEQGGPRRAPGVGRDSASLLLDGAIESFKGAIAVDSSLAQAWAELAAAYHWRASSQSSQEVADSLYSLSLEASARAIGLDDELWQAWNARAFAFTLTWQFDSAEVALERADDFSPNASQWTWTFLHRARGEATRSADAFRRAYQRDVQSDPLRRQFAEAMACIGDYQSAFGLARTAADSLAIHVRSGDPDEAVRLYETRFGPGEPPPYLIPYAYAQTGRMEEAERWVEVRRAVGSSSVEGVYEDFALGDTAAVIDRFEGLVAVRHQALIVLSCRPLFREFMGIPAVREMFEEAGLPTELR